MANYQQRVSDTFNERMRLIRFRRRKESTRFRDEFRIVPRWLVWTIFVLFIIAQAGLLIANFGFHAPFGTGGPLDGAPDEIKNSQVLTALVMAGMLTAAAIPLAAFLFFLGYIYRDAKRRGMNAQLWTLLVLILSPAWLATGFVIYFMVREPLPYNCPQCAAVVGPRFNFCPNCKNNLQPYCPQCKREVLETDKFCPNCANELAAPPAAETPGRIDAGG
ncbi:MAG: hypothetical protein PVS2B2_07650 [Candidatus Acidiferrum sp.]